MTDFLKRQNFLLSGILFCSSRVSFSTKKCPKRTFPSDFVKLGSEILFWQKKWPFVCFVAPLSDFGLLFLIEAFIELRKMLIRKKVFKMQLTLLLDRWSVLDNFFFQNLKYKECFMCWSHTLSIILGGFKSLQTSGLFKKQKK